ncbi:hypothetical protein LOAG_12584 [Loa loa]|uniref:Uncharacterized protein n=1 Tax=Loa loa TaxID=7209 RepID=A0A1S0TLF9_LOALO|nr:hypothetical protein LOAG_12584 [Loa loa]EFO15924.1 hypothetical protein LOAG_12584 [Loa loa]
MIRWIPVKIPYVIMSGGTSSLIFLVLLLSFTRQFINSEPFILLPPPAYIFSGNSDFNLSQQNRMTTFAYDIDQTSNSASDNPFTSTFQKSSSIPVHYGSKQPPILTSTKSMKYRGQEELKNNFYKEPNIVNVNDEMSTNEAIFHSFRDDNFDEKYRRINETYFSEGITSEVKTLHRPYIQVCQLPCIPCILAIFSISHIE